MGLVYDRRNKTTYEDKQYYSNSLNFLYNNFFGRVILKILILPFVSKIAGVYNNSKISTRKIEKFIKDNNINMADFEEEKYNSFNEFFRRKKKDIVIDYSKEAFISPADSKLLVYKVDDGLKLKIKNSTYSLEELINDKNELLQKFKGGNCLVFRLAVNDYHRYHFIDDGRLVNQYEIKGKFHTVSSFSQNEKVYSKNHRVCNILETNNFGDIICIEVGAMLVGKVHNNDVTEFKKGEEKGYFEFGGSTIVVITKNNIVIDGDIINNSNNNIETKLRARRENRKRKDHLMLQASFFYVSINI